MVMVEELRMRMRMRMRMGGDGRRGWEVRLSWVWALGYEIWLKAERNRMLLLVWGEMGWLDGWCLSRGLLGDRRRVSKVGFTVVTIIILDTIRSFI